MKRRYGVVISAAMLALQLSGNAGAQVAAPALEELEAISALLDANDVEGLRAYLEIHPELLQGESELARLLRNYMLQSADMTAFLGIAEDATASSDDDDPPTPPGEGALIVSIY